MKAFKILFCISILCSMLFLQISCAQEKGGNNSNQINLRQQEPYGSFLVDGEGISLYLFLKDSTRQSTCYNECAEDWPPVLTNDTNVKAGKGVSSNMLGTVKRKDGSLQVTYNEHPLYYYEDDKETGDVTGQDVKEFGAEWYLVKATGEKMGDVEEK